VTKILEIRNLNKTFTSQYGELRAVDNVDLTLSEGEKVSIMGPSGCGKTTLLNLLGLVMKPTSGEVIILGRNANQMSDSEKAHMRNSVFGYVVQNFALLYGETVEENIRMPLLYRKKRLQKKEEDARIRAILNKVELNIKWNEKVEHLSGGQQQRVAIARALVNEPKIILADEPTGALDSKTSENVLDLLLDTANRHQSIIMVTHSERVANRLDRRLLMLDGRIESDYKTAE